MKVWVLLQCANIHDGIMYVGVYRGQESAKSAAEAQMRPLSREYAPWWRGVGKHWYVSEGDELYGQHFHRPVEVHPSSYGDWIILQAEVIA